MRRPYDRRRASNVEYFELSEPERPPGDDSTPAGERSPELAGVDDVLRLAPAFADDDAEALGQIEGSLVDCLAQRYAARQPYTWLGDTLVAMNPREELQLCSSAEITRVAQSTAARRTPHVYAVARAAHAAARLTCTNQTIACLGCSGAGKTEAARVAIAYLMQTSIDEKEARNGLTRSRSIEHKVVLAGEILEAFGNASTPTNHHSSRFGRNTEIQYGSGAAHVTAANIFTFGLEKSRAVGQATFGSNFHVLYQLCAGASERDRVLLGGGDLKLGHAHEYAYLTAGGGSRPTDCDDGAEYVRLLGAMNSIGMDADLILHCKKVLAAILFLGNVPVEESADGNCFFRVNDEAKAVAYLLNVEDEDELFDGMCHKQVQGTTASAQNARVSLAREEVMDCRDALAMVLYEGVWKTVGKALNSALSSSRQPVVSLHVTDIFGFEQSPLLHGHAHCGDAGGRAGGGNSFGQLMANYASEKLHQAYLQHRFTSTAQLYIQEGVPLPGQPAGDAAEMTTLEKPPDGGNDSVVQLIEGQVSLLTIMRDVCRQPQGSDEIFLDRVQRDLKHHPALLPLPSGAAAAASQHKVGGVQQGFAIQHYRHYQIGAKGGHGADGGGGGSEEAAASATSYTGKFLDRNRSLLPREVQDAVQSTTSRFVRELVASATGVRQPDSGELRELGAGRRGSAVAQGHAILVASEWMDSLQALCRRWGRDSMHWIRCISSPRRSASRSGPTASSASSSSSSSVRGLDTAAVLMQLRQANIPEYILARKRSYALHMDFRAFLARWGSVLSYAEAVGVGLDPSTDVGDGQALALAPATLGGDSGGSKRNGEQEKQACQLILAKLERPHGFWALGPSRVCLTTEAIARLDALCELAGFLVVIKGKLARRDVAQIGARVVGIQCRFRYKVQIRRFVTQRFTELCHSRDVGACYSFFAKHYRCQGVDPLVCLRMQQHTTRLVEGAKAVARAVAGDDVIEDIMEALERYRDAEPAMVAEYAAMLAKREAMVAAASARINSLVSSVSAPEGTGEEMLGALSEYMGMQSLVAESYGRLQQQCRRLAVQDKRACRRWFSEISAAKEAQATPDAHTGQSAAALDVLLSELASVLEQQRRCESYAAHGFGFARELVDVRAVEQSTKDQLLAAVNGLLAHAPAGGDDSNGTAVSQQQQQVDAVLRQLDHWPHSPPPLPEAAVLALRERQAWFGEAETLRTVLLSVATVATDDDSGAGLSSIPPMLRRIYESARQPVRELLQGDYDGALLLAEVRGLRYGGDPAAMRAALHRQGDTDSSVSDATEPQLAHALTDLRVHFSTLVAEATSQLTQALEVDSKEYGAVTAALAAGRPFASQAADDGPTEEPQQGEFAPAQDLTDGAYDALVGVRTSLLATARERITGAIDTAKSGITEVASGGGSGSAVLSSSLSELVRLQVMEFAGWAELRDELEGLQQCRQEVSVAIGAHLDSIREGGSKDVRAIASVLVLYAPHVVATEAESSSSSSSGGGTEPNLSEAGDDDATGAAVRSDSSGMRTAWGRLQQKHEQLWVEFEERLRASVGDAAAGPEAEADEAARAWSTSGLITVLQEVSHVNEALSELGQALRQRYEHESHGAASESSAEVGQLRRRITDLQEELQAQAAVLAERSEQVSMLEDEMVEFAAETDAQLAEKSSLIAGLEQEVVELAEENEELEQAWAEATAAYERLMERVPDSSREAGLRQLAARQHTRFKFRKWATYVRQLRLARTLLARIRTAGQLEAFMAWVVTARTAVRCRRIAAEVVVPPRSFTLQYYFRRLREHAESERGALTEVEAIVERVLRPRAVRESFVGFFVRWIGRTTYTSRRHWRPLAARADRWHRARCLGVIMWHWYQHAQTRANRRRIVQALWKRATALSLQASWATWQRAELRRRFQMVAVKQRLRQLNGGRARDSLRRWASHCRRKQLHLQILSRMLAQQLQGCFEAWARHKRVRRMALASCSLKLTDVRDQCFHAWLLWAPKEAQSRAVAALASVKQRHAARVLGRLSMRRVLHGWRSSVRAAVTQYRQAEARGKLLARFLGKRSAEASAEAFEGWRSLCLRIEARTELEKLQREQAQLAQDLQEQERAFQRLGPRLYQVFNPLRNAFRRWLMYALEAHEARRKLFHCVTVLSKRILYLVIRRWQARARGEQRLTRAQIAEKRRQAMRHHGGRQAFARWWHHRCESTLRRVCHDLTHLLADCHWFNQSVDFGSDWDYDLGYRTSLSGDFWLRSIQPSVEDTAADSDGTMMMMGEETLHQEGRRLQRMVAATDDSTPRRALAPLVFVGSPGVYASSQLRSGAVSPKRRWSGSSRVSGMRAQHTDETLRQVMMSGGGGGGLDGRTLSPPVEAWDASGAVSPPPPWDGDTSPVRLPNGQLSPTGTPPRTSSRALSSVGRINSANSSTFSAARTASHVSHVSSLREGSSPRSPGGSVGGRSSSSFLLSPSKERPLEISIRICLQ